MANQQALLVCFRSGWPPGVALLAPAALLTCDNAEGPFSGSFLSLSVSLLTESLAICP